MKANYAASITIVLAGFSWAPGWVYSQNATPAAPAHVPLHYARPACGYYPYPPCY